MACLPISPPGRLLSWTCQFPARPSMQPDPSSLSRPRDRLRSAGAGAPVDLTGSTGLEPATSRVTVECSNQTELRPQNFLQPTTCSRSSSPYGSRTRLCTVKGCRPKPIDERARNLGLPYNFRSNSGNGIRTRVWALRGPRPSPLDDTARAIAPEARTLRRCYGPLRGPSQILRSQQTTSRPSHRFSISNHRGGGNRTPNRRFWRPVLYQLSYTPKAQLAVVSRQPIEQQLQNELPTEYSRLSVGVTDGN